MTRAITGGCACGAVRYECDAPPASMVNCHCRDCQRAGGSGYAPTLVVPASALRVLRGAPKYHEVRGESGSMARRGFCSECGSPLFAGSSARPDFVGIRAGSLDDPGVFRPTADGWVGSAQTWDAMDPAVPKFARDRTRGSPEPEL
jgi:hypothetical protein